MPRYQETPLPPLFHILKEHGCLYIVLEEVGPGVYVARDHFLRRWQAVQAILSMHAQQMRQIDSEEQTDEAAG